MHVRLNSIEKVKDFVNDVSRFETDIDLISSRYVIDAKSLMGILSLDLSKPILVKVYDDNEKPRVFQALEKYACA